MSEADQIRCFIAIELSTEVRKILDTTIHLIARNLGSGFRWVAAKDIHLTLKFLGNTPKILLPQLEKAITMAVGETPVFPITIQKMGVFPNLRQPRVFWAGVQGPTALLDIQKKIDIQTSKLGFPGEARPFSPHLTLARTSNSITQNDIGALAKLLAGNDLTFSITMDVQNITLFQSVLRPQGPIHTPLTRIHL